MNRRRSRTDSAAETGCGAGSGWSARARAVPRRSRRALLVSADARVSTLPRPRQPPVFEPFLACGAAALPRGRVGSRWCPPFSCACAKAPARADPRPQVCRVLCKGRGVGAGRLRGRGDGHCVLTAFSSLTNADARGRLPEETPGVRRCSFLRVSAFTCVWVFFFFPLFLLLIRSYSACIL